MPKRSVQGICPSLEYDADVYDSEAEYGRWEDEDESNDEDESDDDESDDDQGSR